MNCDVLSISALLQSGSHNLANTVFGIAAKRYLCVAPDGVVYSLPVGLLTIKWIFA